MLCRKSIKRTSRFAAFLLSLSACAAGVILNSFAHAQENIELNILHVQGNVYMLHAGSAGNIAVQTGNNGILLVNALRQGLADEIVGTLASLTPAPIRYIINTNDSLHNTSGNAELAARGMFGATPALGPGDTPGATLVAHENVLFRLTLLASRTGSFPEAGIPRNVYYDAFKDIYWNGEPVFIQHQPNAVTDGDSIVLFRKSDTIASGDIFISGEYPPLDVTRGGSIHGLISAVNHIIALAVPERLQEGGTRIIPGRGRLANEADVVEYRNMLVMVRDRVQALVDQGMTLAQVQAARPTLDFDPEFNGQAAGERFVAAVYASLTATD